MAEEKAPKATYFPEIPALDVLQTVEDPKIDGQNIITGSIPWKKLSLGPFDVTNQITPGLVGEDASIIKTGGPNTMGLIIRGNNYTSPAEKWVAVGSGTNSIAYSLDGVTWVGLGTSIFSTKGWCVAFNGTIWVAGGQGTNSLAYSYDGITWIGLGTSIFNLACYGVAWNGTIWVAGGGSTNTLAYSSDGINWTGLGETYLEVQSDTIAWNGTIWVAGGSGGSFSIYSSTDGITWTGRLASTTISSCKGIAWNGSLFLAVGQGGTRTLASSSNGTSWTGIVDPLTQIGQSVAWNGTVWVRTGGGGGTNTLSYSSNTTSWTGLGNTLFANAYGVAWNGTIFVAVGDPGTHCIATSTDGITWVGVDSTTFGTQGEGIASMPAPLLIPAISATVTNQTADLQQWQDSNEVVLAEVSATGVITAPNFISSIAIGTQPYTTTSTTLNTNLNADMVDSVHVASLTDARLLRYESTGTQIENATVTETSGALGGITTISMSGQLTNTLAIGISPFAVTSTTVNTNLNADLLDGVHGSTFINAVSDTASINLTLTGQSISGDVLPAGVDHSALASLNTASYTHLTATNHTDLTDAGDSTLHYHATDRDSANFTGTNWTDLTDGGATTLHSHTDITGNAGTATALQTARLINGTSFDGTANIVNNFPRGFLINGKIVPSVASSNLTVAIKGLDGNDPSATNPVYCRINDAVRSITAALSVTKNAGTNWFGSGSSETATREVDYFVYLGYDSTDGVVLGFGRLPFALGADYFLTTGSLVTTQYDYFAGSTTTNFSDGDFYENVGRFSAVLSAGAGYTWSLPSSVGDNILIVQRPIYYSRAMIFDPTVTSSSGTITSYTTADNYYQLIGNNMYVRTRALITDAGTGAGTCIFTIPMPSVYQNFGIGKDTGVTNKALLTATNGATIRVTFYDGTTAIATSAELSATTNCIVDTA